MSDYFSRGTENAKIADIIAAQGDNPADTLTCEILALIAGGAGGRDAREWWAWLEDLELGKRPEPPCEGTGDLRRAARLLLRELGKATGDTPIDRLASLPDVAMMNHVDLAKALTLAAEPLRQRLNRWRKTNSDGWQELTEAKAKEPRYIYRVGDIRDVLQAAIAAQ